MKELQHEGVNIERGKIIIITNKISSSIELLLVPSCGSCRRRLRSLQCCH